MQDRKPEDVTPFPPLPSGLVERTLEDAHHCGGVTVRVRASESGRAVWDFMDGKPPEYFFGGDAP